MLAIRLLATRMLAALVEAADLVAVVLAPYFELHILHALYSFQSQAVLLPCPLFLTRDELITINRRLNINSDNRSMYLSR